MPTPVSTSSDASRRACQPVPCTRFSITSSGVSRQLFISHQTIQYHLHKVDAKLGISARTHLHRVLPGD
jgi:hypothetical protein